MDSASKLSNQVRATPFKFFENILHITTSLFSYGRLIGCIAC